MPLQDAVWQISITAMALLLVSFAYVFIHSGVREHDYGPLVKRAYRVRARFFLVLVLVLGPAMIYNLFGLPYDAARASAGAPGDALVIEAIGHQWRWELSRDHVAVNQPVEFVVTTADVTHSFGIYDTEMHLVAQTQAMPGYTNRLRYTFTKAGTYQVLCMEYCGVGHHVMMTEIKVL